LESETTTQSTTTTSKRSKRVIHWLVICINNFTQLEPWDYCVWTLTCLFLSASTNPLLRALHREVFDHIRLDTELFLLTALDFFFNQDLDDKEKELFISSFVAKKEELFVKLVDLCSVSPPSTTTSSTTTTTNQLDEGKLPPRSPKPQSKPEPKPGPADTQ